MAPFALAVGKAISIIRPYEFFPKICSYNSSFTKFICVKTVFCQQHRTTLLSTEHHDNIHRSRNIDLYCLQEKAPRQHPQKCVRLIVGHISVDAVLFPAHDATGPVLQDL